MPFINLLFLISYFIQNILFFLTPLLKSRMFFHREKTYKKINSKGIIRQFTFKIKILKCNNLDQLQIIS